MPTALALWLKPFSVWAQLLASSCFLLVLLFRFPVELAALNQRTPKGLSESASPCCPFCSFKVPIVPHHAYLHSGTFPPHLGKSVSQRGEQLPPCRVAPPLLLPRFTPHQQGPQAEWLAEETVRLRCASSDLCFFPTPNPSLGLKSPLLPLFLL